MAIRSINTGVQPSSSAHLARRNQGATNNDAAQTKVQPAHADTVNYSSKGQQLAASLYRETIYDQPRDNRSSTAISTYKAYANLERREQVQALMHVSVYA